MQKIKFRNHISIVAEQLGSILLVALIFCVTVIAENLGNLRDADLSFLGQGAGMWIMAGCLAVLLLILGRSLLIWARTYISIQENAIVIERDTLNKRKHTIGIKNISNINTEQNLFEMIVGTCKVKLDTNSLSTADKTDVKIVLKKQDAKAFCEQIEKMLREYEGQSGQTEEKADEKVLRDSAYDITMDFAALFVHGLFSVSPLSLLIVIGGAVGTATVISEIFRDPNALETALSVLASILVAGAIFFSALWDIIKGFVIYYGFRAKREGDKIYIRYGLLKKVEYTIPVDKIQALKINQSFFARLTGKYMAEIVNVGLDDEQENAKAFLLLYGTKEKLREQLAVLLPEFADSAVTETERIPRRAWAAWMLPFGIFLLAAIVTGGYIGTWRPEYRTYVWMAVLALFILAVLCMILKYVTAGLRLEEDFLVIARGYFGRRAVVIKYDKIQYIQTSQNFIARVCGIEKGEVHLLASANNRNQALPYFKSGYTEAVKRKIVANPGQL